MKLILIIVAAVLIAFFAVQLYFIYEQNNIETYSYKVKETYDTFEIRYYQRSLFTSVKLPNEGYRKSSTKGFSILAGYIFGSNERNEKIAMTSPVSMSLEDSMTMMFLVPKEYEKLSLPKPKEAIIEFTEEPAKKVAAIKFGGWVNEAKIEKYKQQLMSALDAHGIKYSNRFYFLGYNAPFEVFNRRNEVIVELL